MHFWVNFVLLEAARRRLEDTDLLGRPFRNKEWAFWNLCFFGSFPSCPTFLIILPSSFLLIAYQIFTMDPKSKFGFHLETTWHNAMSRILAGLPLESYESPLVPAEDYFFLVEEAILKTEDPDEHVEVRQGRGK